MEWLIPLGIALFYVHVFNAVARLYFESEGTLTLRDLWRRFLPPIDLRIQL
jgi:hypothetical protein